MIKPVLLVTVPEVPNEETPEDLKKRFHECLTDDFNVIVVHDPSKEFSIQLITNDPNIRIIKL